MDRLYSTAKYRVLDFARGRKKKKPFDLRGTLRVASRKKQHARLSIARTNHTRETTLRAKDNDAE